MGEVRLPWIFEEANRPSLVEQKSALPGAACLGSKSRIRAAPLGIPTACPVSLSRQRKSLSDVV
jgi:hypothetical protein